MPLLRLNIILIFITIPLLIFLSIDRYYNPERYVNHMELKCNSLWWVVEQYYWWLLDWRTYNYCIIADNEKLEIKKILLDELKYFNNK